MEVWKLAAVALIAMMLSWYAAPPPRPARAQEMFWIDLPGRNPPSMMRLKDVDAGVTCYLIPGSYEGLGVVYSPALSCVRDE